MIEAWMEFAGGKRATFYATTAYAQDAPIILEVGFEKGRATIMGSVIQISSNDGEVRLIDCRQSKSGIGKEYWGMGHEVCIQDFYSCLKSNRPYQNDMEGVANTLYTTMRIYEDAGSKEREEA